eukprot:14008697-Alexandrium_andersonii.AAC.1
MSASLVGSEMCIRDRCAVLGSALDLVLEVYRQCTAAHSHTHAPYTLDTVLLTLMSQCLTPFDTCKMRVLDVLGPTQRLPQCLSQCLAQCLSAVLDTVT